MRLKTLNTYSSDKLHKYGTIINIDHDGGIRYKHRNILFYVPGKETYVPIPQIDKVESYTTKGFRPKMSIKITETTGTVNTFMVKKFGVYKTVRSAKALPPLLSSIYGNKYIDG